MSRSHNQESEEDRNRRIVFHQTLNAVEDKKAKIASISGELAQLFKRAEHFNWSKEDFDFALKIRQSKKSGEELVEGLRKQIEICEMCGMPEANLFTIKDRDRTPLVEKAFAYGKAAGLRRAEAKSPYDPGSDADQEWMKGWHEGNEEIHLELADILDEVIPGEGNGEETDDDTDGEGSEQTEKNEE